MEIKLVLSLEVPDKDVETLQLEDPICWAAFRSILTKKVRDMVMSQSEEDGNFSFLYSFSIKNSEFLSTSLKTRSGKNPGKIWSTPRGRQLEEPPIRIRFKVLLDTLQPF